MTNAQAAVDAAQSAYTEAVTANSYTFFKWLGATTVAECMKTDRGAEYTHIGKEDDATSIANLKQALAYLEQCNQIRKGENLSDLRVATDMTAEAEACANWSSVDAQHHGTFENLAWGTDPYRLWYTEEKQNVAKGSGETGHYKNLVNSEVLVTGYGYNSGSTCSAQEFALGPLDDTYTVSEYEAKLDEYLAFVETAAADKKSALTDAQATLADAQAKQTEAVANLAKFKATLETASVTPTVTPTTAPTSTPKPTATPTTVPTSTPKAVPTSTPAPTATPEPATTPAIPAIEPWRFTVSDVSNEHDVFVPGLLYRPKLPNVNQGARIPGDVPSVQSECRRSSLHRQ